MKKRNMFGSLLVVALMAALVFLLPTTAQAATPDDLEYYVDIDTFSTYLREAFLDQNADEEANSHINLSQFNIPATATLKEQVLRQALLAAPELAAMADYYLDLPGYETQYISTLWLTFNASSYKNNDYFYDIQRAAAPLLEGIADNDALSEAEKALLLHDRLALWTKRGTDEDFVYTAYGALVNRVAAASGYVEAYRYLLACVGIYSEGNTSRILGHRWNIVYIDGVPYHVDVIWDDWDDGGKVGHRNFLRSSDGIFATGHSATNAGTGETVIDYDTTPQDSRYDKAYWQSASTAIHLVDGKFYYLGEYDGCLYRRDNNVTTEVTFLGWDCQINALGNKLLYSSQQTVSLLDPYTLEETQIVSFSAPSNEYIFEGFAYEKFHIVGVFSKGRYSDGTFDRQKIPYFYVLPGKTGWHKDACGAVFLDENSQPVRNKWMKDANGWRYLGADGYTVSEQWQKDTNGWCYLNKDGYMATNQWAKDSRGWCWLDSNGRIAKNSWVRDKYGLYYVASDGYRVNSAWAYDGIGWRFLYSNGRARINTSFKIGNKYYYFDADGYRVTGWRKFDNSWRWYDENGVEARNTWFRDEKNRWSYASSTGNVFTSKWIRYDGSSYDLTTNGPAYDENDFRYQYYYVKSDCYMATGWTQIDGNWYYFNESGVMERNGWVKDSSGWCYLNKNGKMWKDIWIYDNGTSLTTSSYATADYSGGKLYYIDAQGHMAVGWKEINGYWYWFDNSGVKGKNRWVQDSSGWCYLGSGGNILINCWVEDSAGKCYLDGNGRMVKNNWVFYQNRWYYVDAGGHQVTGWHSVGSKWYYFNSTGSMVSKCWLFETENGPYALGGYTKSSRIQYTAYYLLPGGEMATGWTQIDGAWFWFHSSGVMAKNGWMKDSVGWCYLSEDGSMLTSCWKTDAHGTCYISESGYILNNQWLELKGYWYYLDGSGYRVSGWKQIGSNWYYFYSSGIMAVNTAMSGGWIDGNGVWKAY